MKLVVWSVFWLVLVGLVSAILAQIVNVGVLVLIPPGIDLTGNYLKFVTTPSAIVVAVLTGLALTKVLRRVSLPVALIFPATYALAEFFVLRAVSNPMAFRLSTLAITLTVTVLVVLWRRKGMAVEKGVAVETGVAVAGD